jgi:hypothetical protein
MNTPEVIDLFAFQAIELFLGNPETERNVPTTFGVERMGDQEALKVSIEPVHPQ